jgi:anthraniloyl-CoA monooxygenase
LKIVCIGGGPAGLYFALLMKRDDPAHEVTVIERNAPQETFGWGVVFSDETLSNLDEADPSTFAEISRSFARWDAIDIHAKGRTVRSTGHGFAGIARKRLLGILQARCRELGVKLVYQTEVADLSAYAGADLIVAADGVRSGVRARFEGVFRPSLDVRQCRYMWLGTRHLFDAFTFAFEETEHGIFQAHAYRFDAETSTFIVECPEETWRGAGLDRATTAESVAFLERLFGKYIGDQPLLENRSSWINFVTVRNQTWRHGNVVLLGDAAHTAHFSIGSGTKLAMEDSIALAAALRGGGPIERALEAYEADRRPQVERTQKAAQDSLQWFETVGRYWSFASLPFAFGLLTRSKRITYENMRLRDPALVAAVADDFARTAFEAVGEAPPATPPPPMFTPFKLRDLRLENRVAVSPMCMYSADEGTVGDFHLVHLGARAMGGAGLIFTEMTDVSAEGRITPGCAGMYSPEHVPAWKRIVDYVHRRSRAKICMQLGHAGRKGSTRLMWEGMDEPLPSGNWPLISASPLAYLPHGQVPRAMDRRDMDAVRDQFVRAAGMAEQAGFDMIELHMAHGYLLASFLSPLTNVRTDEYGGPVEQRMRYPLEVFEAVRAAWPAHKPMSVRVSAVDWAPGGMSGADTVVVVRALRERGLDVVDVSTGQTVADGKPVFGRMFQTAYSDQVRNDAHVPAMAVGNISTHDQVNSILTAGRADLCLLARPHLSDPNWTLHAASAQGFLDPRWPDPYSPVDAGRPR